MSRVTEKDLGTLVNQINEETNQPTSAYTRKDNGELCANIGHYYLDGAYGGHKLVQIVSGGGITEITRGFVPKRELYQMMVSYLDGITAGKQQAK